MARINDIERFNTRINTRRDFIQLNLDEHNTVIVEKNEIKDMILNFIEEDDLFFANGLTRETKNALSNRIETRLNRIEASLQQDLENKFNSIADKIVSASTTRIFNEEVNRRVDEKLQKLKELLE